MKRIVPGNVLDVVDESGVGKEQLVSVDRKHGILKSLLHGRFLFPVYEKCPCHDKNV